MLVCLAYIVVMKLTFVGEATRDGLSVVVVILTCADGMTVFVGAEWLDVELYNFV